MLVDKSMLPVLAALFRDYVGSDDPMTFMRKNRKQIQQHVDTITEQVTLHFTEERPRNSMGARQLLSGIDRKALAHEDGMVIRCLVEVLREYEVFLDKRYVDTAQVLNSVFIGNLRDLCLKLAFHSIFAGSQESKQLAEILGRIGS